MTDTPTREAREALETIEGYILDNDVSLAGIRPDLATLRAALDKLDAIQSVIHKKARHSTHWDGCHKSHVLCAILRILET